MDADRVVSMSRQAFGKFITLLMREELCSTAKIHSNKTNPFFRSLFEREAAVRRNNDPAVFPGRRVERAGEVQRTAGNDRAARVEFHPVLPLGNDNGPITALYRDLSAGKGESGNQPELT